MSKEIEEFKQRKLAEMVGQCTPSQQNFFHRMYPNGVAADQFEHALRQVEYAVRKNKLKEKTS